MNPDKIDKNNDEGKKVERLLEKTDIKESMTLDEKLDYIYSKADRVKTKGNAIVLDRNNKDHVEWFEDD